MEKGGNFKCDRYESPNFFIEHFSHHERKTLGGPFKALDDKCEWFLYYFTKTDSLYLFDTQKLVDFLLTNKDTLRYHKVYKSNATGFIVPIVLLTELFLSLEELK